MGSTGIVIGAGDRGFDAYTTALLDEPTLGRVVAVAEPDPARRHRFATRYEVAPQRCSSSWTELLDGPRLADWALVATGDRHHVEPTIAALEAGYHVLLEKPMALDESDATRLVTAAEQADRVLQICHVYRYSNLFTALHRVVAEGRLGRVLSIQLSENVAFWHYAHSYVRGLTRRSDVPMLLQKSCHDLDLLHWLAGAPPARVTSQVRATELVPEHAPPGAPEHCIEGCPHAPTCPYDAVALYRGLDPLLGDLAMARRPVWLGPAAKGLRRVKPVADAIPVAAVRRRLGWRRWPVSAVTDDPTPDALDRALATTTWGRCVWRVPDNDQPAAQVVTISFANDVLASFTMQSSSHRSMREVRVDGTHGTARGRLHAIDGELVVHHHKSGRAERIRVAPAFDGHGGGERPLFVDFLRAIEGGGPPLTSARESLDSHRIAFAALASVERGTAVDL